MFLRSLHFILFSNYFDGSSQNPRLSHSWPRNVPFLSPSSICTSVHPSLTHTFPFSLALFLSLSLLLSYPVFLTSIFLLKSSNLSPYFYLSLKLPQLLCLHFLFPFFPSTLCLKASSYVEKKWKFYQG